MIEESVLLWRTRGFGPAAIRLRDNGQFIGKSGLNYVSKFDEIEVKWILKPEYWGHGYATEAGGAWVDWCLANTSFKYVVARIVPDNQRSVQVAKRLKMELSRKTFDGTLFVEIYSTAMANEADYRPDVESQ
jgi:RimJ/RimL family protein N-acetyltransferase